MLNVFWLLCRSILPCFLSCCHLLQLITDFCSYGYFYYIHFLSFKLRVVSKGSITIIILQNIALTMFTTTAEIYTTFFCFYDINYYSFTSTQIIPFSISSKTDLMVMNSLRYCLFEKVFITLFLRDSLAKY